MQEIPLDNLVLASNLVHYFHGAAILTAAVVETYSYDNPAGKLKIAIPVSFILFGFLSVIAIIHFLGNWNFRLLSETLHAKRVFLILNAVSFLFISGGLCSLMAFMYSDAHKIWRTLFLFFLLGAGVLYLSVYTKVNPDAAGNAFVIHLPVFITLVLGVLCKVIAFKINKKAVHVAGFVFLMMAAFGLLSYRETPKSFKSGSVVIQAVVKEESRKSKDTRRVSSTTFSRASRPSPFQSSGFGAADGSATTQKKPGRRSGNDKTATKHAKQKK